MRFLFKIGKCIYLVSFWGYKKYIPYFIGFEGMIWGSQPEKAP